jgi:hypothetical protein
MLAIEPWFAGSISAEGDGFFKAIKIRSTPSFGWEVKLETPCRKSLLHVKNTSKYEQRYFEFSDSITRGLWWTDKEFSPVDIIPQ